MNLLREYIRMLLTEAAKTVDDVIANDMKIVIYPGARSRGAVEGARIYYATATGGTKFRNDGVVDDLDNPSALGQIEIEKFGPTVFGHCDDAFLVSWADAEHGWGPLLYDVAIEYATLNGGGLMSDRQAVSRDAEGVWSYYKSNRGDTGGIQLDDLKNTLTPDEQDNCDQTLARDHSYRTGPNMLKNWAESYFSKRWTKAPTTINALKAAGKLVDHT